MLLCNLYPPSPPSLPVPPPPSHFPEFEIDESEVALCPTSVVVSTSSLLLVSGVVSNACCSAHVHIPDL